MHQLCYNYKEGSKKNVIHTTIQNFCKNNSLKSLQQHSKNEPIKMILSLLSENPSFTKDELTTRIGKSRATVTRLLSKLVEEGKIARIGSNKSGQWKIL